MGNKNFLNNLLIYSFGEISVKCISFLLIPIYTRALNPSDYGIISMLENFFSIGSIVVSLGLTSGFLIEYNAEKDLEKKHKFFVNTFYSYCIYSIPILISFIIFSKYISLAFFGNKSLNLYIIIFSILIIVEIFKDTIFIYLRSNEYINKYIIINIISFLSLAILRIYFIAVLKMKVDGYVFSTLISYILIFLITFLININCFKKFTKIDFSYIKPLIEIGIPIMPGTLAGWALMLIDRIFLSHYSNMEQVGIYSLGYKFGMILDVIFITPFSMLWNPKAFKIYREASFEQARIKFKEILTLYLGTLLFIFVCLVSFIKPIFDIVTSPKYSQAYTVIPIILISYIFIGLSNIFNCNILVTKKSKYMTIVSLFSAIINVGLNFLLIPRYKLYGAAFATLLSYLVMMILTYKLGQSFFKINYEHRKIQSLIYLAVLIFSFIIIFDLFIKIIIVNIILKLLLVIAFGIYILKENKILKHFNFLEKAQLWER